MSADETPPILPVRRLHNYVYCPRLFYLQWVENLFQESEDTARGDNAHRKVDIPSNWRQDAAPQPGAEWRSLEIESESLGIRGVMDLVQVESDGLRVVEYKAGSPMRGPNGDWLAKPSDALQVIAYSMLLEEQEGIPIKAGSIYYAETRRHIQVDVNDEDRNQCRQAIKEAQKVAASAICPPPLMSDVRCLHCSAYPFCLPGESRFWAEGTLDPQLEKHPPRPDGDEGEVLIVQHSRATVNLRGGELVVQVEGEVMAKRPIEQLRNVYFYGPVQLTAQALHALLERGVPVAYFSAAGRFLGMASGLSASGVDARRGQYRMFDRPDIRLLLTREIVRCKIHNQRVLLMRNGTPGLDVLTEMGRLRDASQHATDLDEVRGFDGAAAALYFQNCGSIFKPGIDFHLDWQGRNRRPPRDPVNALLSLGYSILAKEITGVCHAVGLDPFLGFFHQPRYGRPALALDLMEEFRPLIADSVAISLINRQEVGPEDFVRTTRGVHLKDEGRKQFWRSWARRMETEVLHPEFGYRMSYRRMLDVQARQMWRFCRGETSRYCGFVTR